MRMEDILTATMHATQTSLSKTSLPHAPSGLSSLSYRSRAVSPLSAEQLRALHEQSQERNRAESVTGLLIYDQQSFFQWLEGPTESLERICASIQRDARHTDLEVLGFRATPMRFFGGWDMHLASRAKPDGQAASTVWNQVLVPLSHASEARAVPARDPVPPSFGAAPGDAFTGREPAVLAQLLLTEQASAHDFVRHALSQLGSFAELARWLLEPAARLLGDWWREDRCQEFEVSLGLCQLQAVLRGLAPAWPMVPVHRAQHHALMVACLPGESDQLTTALDAEMLWQDGWNSSAQHPKSQQGLEHLVGERAIAALTLTLSPAFSRAHWLPRIRDCIGRVRAVSLNRELIVVVSGRLFLEQPTAWIEVGADACVSSAAGLSAVIQAGLDAPGLRQRSAR